MRAAPGVSTPGSLLSSQHLLFKCFIFNYAMGAFFPAHNTETLQEVGRNRSHFGLSASWSHLFKANAI